MYIFKFLIREKYLKEHSVQLRRELCVCNLAKLKIKKQKSVHTCTVLKIQFADIFNFGDKV